MTRLRRFIDRENERLHRAWYALMDFVTELAPYLLLIAGTTALLVLASIALQR